MTHWVISLVFLEYWYCSNLWFYVENVYYNFKIIALIIQSNLLTNLQTISSKHQGHITAQFLFLKLKPTSWNWAKSRTKHSDIWAFGGGGHAHPNHRSAVPRLCSSSGDLMCRFGHVIHPCCLERSLESLMVRTTSLFKKNSHCGLYDL